MNRKAQPETAAAPPVPHTCPCCGGHGFRLAVPRDAVAWETRLREAFARRRTNGGGDDAKDRTAFAHGRVVDLFDSERGGKTIYQRGRDARTIYYYAHLDRYAAGLRKGDAVRQGQVVGYVGDTGNAVPGNYHLHFAIWITPDTTQYWDGDAINPYPLLRGAAGAAP